MSDIQFPLHDPPVGTPIADRKQAAPMIKLMTKMMPKRIKPKLLGKSHGIESSNKVKIKQKKIPYY